LKGTLTLMEGTEREWDSLLTTGAGVDYFVVERNPVARSTLGAEEIREFLEEIVTCQPKSAVKWLQDFLPRVKTIYAFQFIDVDSGQGRRLFDEIRSVLQGDARAIIQADYEGFSEESGCHILWQFSSSVKGSWEMAVRKNGRWVRFQMELGNRKHRLAFKKGEVPEGVKLLG